MDRKWSNWEYQLLSKNVALDETARRLGRTNEDVARRIDRDYEGTLAGWYRRRRCEGSPSDVNGVLRAASQVFTNEFPEVLDEGCVEGFTFEVLREVFRYFDPKKANPRVPAPKRFLKVFLTQFRRRLNRYSKRRRRTLHRLRFRGVPNCPERHYSCPVEEAFDFWSRQLYSRAVQRLPQEVQRCLEMRRSGRRVKEMAQVLRLNPKTVSNLFSMNRLAKIVRGEVRAMVLEIPAPDLCRVIAYLLHAEDLNQDQIGRLLCLPEWVIAGVCQSIEDENTPAARWEEVVRLVGDEACMKRVA